MRILPLAAFLHFEGRQAGAASAGVGTVHQNGDGDIPWSVLFSTGLFQIMGTLAIGSELSIVELDEDGALFHPQIRIWQGCSRIPCDLFCNQTI